jgi:hypothetical protein
MHNNISGYRSKQRKRSNIVLTNFQATQDTFLKASPDELGTLAGDEKIHVAAGHNVTANLLSKEHGYVRVELNQPIEGNWRNQWYLVEGDWMVEGSDPQMASEGSEFQIALDDDRPTRSEINEAAAILAAAILTKVASVPEHDLVSRGVEIYLRAFRELHARL